LPDIFVASILYRSSNDWTVWLRKHSFIQPLVAAGGDALKTPAAIGDMKSSELPEPVESGSSVIILGPNRLVGDNERIKVVGISPNSVTLEYKPDAAIVAQKRFNNREEVMPRLQRFKNRVANQEISYDSASNLFQVTLRANQTFSINMMRVIEGRATSKAPPKAVAQSQPTDVQGGAAAQDEDFKFTNVSSPEADAANKLINETNKMQQYLPTNQMK
jgi:hypothetical protein